MTGHPDSHELGAQGAEPPGSAMHTLAPAPDPNRPLPHHATQNAEDGQEAEYPPPVMPPAPSATPVRVVVEDEEPPTPAATDATAALDESLKNIDSDKRPPSMMITSELLRLIPGENDADEEDPASLGELYVRFCDSPLNDNRVGRSSLNSHCGLSNGPKTWSQQDMESALDALRNHNMSLTKASATYGIPSTTLWQRAHRLGIDTPKKEGPSKSWSESNLHNALQALRTGTISANKASKAYGIPSSTLYKIARREGIRLAAPFNAAPTTWRPGDLERALQSIRSGHSSVQRASTEFGIPTGTLYGRCKREGIELSRSNPTPWSEDAMGEALEAVRVGQMSINQAAIHFNLPYSSLYGRFKRCKYENDLTNNSVENPQQGRSSQDTHHNQQSSQIQNLENNLDHRNIHDNSTRHTYPIYHHLSHTSTPAHNQSEPNAVNHSNQDCVSIS